MSNSQEYTIIKTEVEAFSCYEQILERLINDVKPVIDFYKTTGHGNWASIRMMAPVIEAISKDNAIKRDGVLKKIGIIYPRIFWAMYRHGLLHNDSMPQSVQLGEQCIGWGFNWEQDTAAKKVGMLYSLNPAIIFENLVALLRVEIINNPKLKNEKLKNSILIVINENQSPGIMTEFLDFINE